MPERGARWPDNFARGLRRHWPATRPIAAPTGYVDLVTFTALHRALGLPPGPITDELLDEAVSAGVAEVDDLDWKSELPPVNNLSQTDVPKDIAAMANSGGGVIVYGVNENQKLATSRKDTGEFDENHERTYRRVAVSAITPPVFGLEVHRLGSLPRAVAVVVPASVDGPHLIYRGEYFGAPIRNHADTEWMKERQIEAAYRARFEERRRSSEAIDARYAEMLAGRDIGNRAWLIAVARPRVPGIFGRPDRDEARNVFEESGQVALSYSARDGVHPLENVDRLNPRPGLKRWTAPPASLHKSSYWKEAWVSVHHDGGVSLAAAVGGHLSGPSSQFEGYEVEARAIECAIADFAGLIRVVAAHLGHGECDVSVGLEWAGVPPLVILTVDSTGHSYDGVSTPLGKFVRVSSTIDAAASDREFHRHVYELAEDCINQGGITYLHAIEKPHEDQ